MIELSPARKELGSRVIDALIVLAIFAGKVLMAVAIIRSPLN